VNGERVVLLNHATQAGGLSLVPPTASPPDLRALSPRAARSARSQWIRRVLIPLLVGEAVLAAVIGGAVTSGLPGGAAPEITASISLAVMWPLALAVTGAYESKLFGAGSEEFRRVFRAGLLLMAVAGFGAVTGWWQPADSLVVLGIPGLTLTGVIGRLVARLHLRRLWAEGVGTRRVLVVGRGQAVLELADRLGRDALAGLQVVGSCVTEVDRERVGRATGLPVGGLDDVLDLAGSCDVDAIVVTSSSETAADYVRRLSWRLEGTGLRLLVAPGVVEVAGSRLHVHPFEGLPLLAVEQPRFSGGARLVKGLGDRALALAALVALTPIFVLIALGVSLTSPGPVFYRQERIGINGRRFTMLKFRSMVVDAEQRLTALQAQNESDGLLFKMRTDPRVTPLGKWLRRFSLDELPQLINVLNGTMSLVGPRPPLPREVAGYDSAVSRRLLVKPGLTGLWQISGRSDLPWDEAVRLDLRYVENWSLALDAQIMWKTARAVLTSSGAY
jgi:exopolysaccharide biosynthesis polyprenyl glycosylphosphotransferase